MPNKNEELHTSVRNAYVIAIAKHGDTARAFEGGGRTRVRRYFGRESRRAKHSRKVQWPRDHAPFSAQLGLSDLACVGLPSGKAEMQPVSALPELGAIIADADYYEMKARRCRKLARAALMTAQRLH